MKLRLTVWGPHFENHCSRDIDAVLIFKKLSPLDSERGLKNEALCDVPGTDFLLAEEESAVENLVTNVALSSPTDSEVGRGGVSAWLWAQQVPFVY